MEASNAIVKGTESRLFGPGNKSIKSFYDGAFDANGDVVYFVIVL